MRWIYGVALAAALLLSASSLRATDALDALRAQISYGREFVDFAPEKPLEPQVYGSALPHVLVKFDDGRVGNDPDNPVKSQVAAFLRRGLPVSLAINANSIGSGSSMSWQDIRDLQDFAESHGTVLHLQTHFNGNLATPFALSHQEIVDELDPSLILRETGYRVRSAVLPGDAGRQEFQRRNRDYLNSIADSLGIWWIQHIVPTDSTEIVNFVPSAETLDAVESAPSNYVLGGSFLSFVRPGMGIPRQTVPTAGINDVTGATAVERVASWPSQYDSVKYYDPNEHYLYGGEHLTGVIPPSHDGWTLTGNGANPATTAAYTQTLWHYMASRLANNFGFTITLHDSAQADLASAITGIDDTEIDRAFSPDHLAWVLAMLSRTSLPDGTPVRPHIKVAGPEDFFRWSTGEFAPGTDLIDNPAMEVPQYAVGDTLGATSEYVWPRGLTAIGVQSSAQPNTTAWLRTLDREQSGNVAKYDRTADNNPYDLIGASVTGVRGRAGGIALDTTVNTVKLSYGNLMPGRYRLSIAVKQSAAASMTLQEYHLAMKLKGYRPNASYEEGFAPAYADTVLRYQWRDAAVAPTLASVAVGEWWGDFQVEFNAPANYAGDLGGSDDGAALIGRSDEATGAFWPQPYANGAAEFIPLPNQSRWAMTLTLFVQLGTATLSYPRLIYLGD